MAIDIFTEERLEAGAALAATRDAKGHWGRALVRTDLSAADLDFLARSFRGCVERERFQLDRYKIATSVVRGLNRR